MGRRPVPRDWPSPRLGEEADDDRPLGISGAHLAVYLAALGVAELRGWIPLPFPAVAGAALGPIVVHIAATFLRGARRCGNG